MSGISPIVFNGSNAYELSLNDFATSWPQGALGIEQVSAGIQLRSPTAGAGAILRIRAIGTNGLLISELSQTHILTVLNNWERAEKTYTLPAGTVKIELRIVAVGGAVLFAQPKLANGTSVGAYATNFAPQLTTITPTGLYTGTITAEQIILTGGERLPDRLLSLNASLISLRSGIDGTDQKIAELKAESLTFTDTMTGKTSKMDADGIYLHTVKASQVQTGLLKSTNDNSWINLDNGRFSFGNGALVWNGTDLGVLGTLTTKTGGTDQAKISITSGKIELFGSSNKSLGFITDTNQFAAGNFPGLTIYGGADAQVVDIGFITGAAGGTPYIRLRPLSSGEPQITLSGTTQLNGSLATSGRITAGSLLVNGSSYIGIIKHPVTNKNIFNPYTDATWISSPNEASQVRIANDGVQIMRNGAVVASW